MDVVYLDFAKAFDKVPHKRLAKNYKHMELEGRYLLGFKASYQIEDKRWALVTQILAGGQCHKDQCLGRSALQLLVPS